jgi:hypothetical protein
MIGSSPLLYNPPVDDPTWAAWGSTHQTDHFQLVFAIRDLVHRDVPMLPIDPVLVPPRFPRELNLYWLMIHQSLHNALSAALGVSNFDLSFVNFEDPASVAVWIQYNAYVHQQLAAAVGRLKAIQTVVLSQQSQAIQPQPEGLQPEPQPSGNQPVQPQGNPGITTIQPQPQQPGAQPQGGLPQPPDQPFPTLQPQPSPAPPPGIQPGTPQLPGNPGAT